MRIRTTEPAEFRFWLTRRYVLVLWQALTKLMRNNIHLSTQFATSQQDAMMAFQKDKAELQGDFQTEFVEDRANMPLGQSPVLLSGVQIRANTEGSQVLVLAPQQGRGIELVLDDTLLYSVAKLLTDACTGAGWSLHLTLPRQFDEPPSPPLLN